jgi:hypothetical protein
LKITIGITTFNRLAYVKMMSLSLRYSDGLEQCSIRVYDDFSDEFGMEELKGCFPFVTELTRRSRNLGSDFNIMQMYHDFLATGDDVLINCDSDMIFRGDWITKIRELLPLTDGVLNCYNSALHHSVERLSINTEPMVRKDAYGSAGTAFTRDVVQRIVSDVKPSRRYDWDWSQYLTKSGVRLLATENSYIQHIGIIGYNCDGARSIDYGLNFYPSNDDTMRLNVSFMEQLIQAKQKVVEQQDQSYYFQVPKYKVLQWVIEPLSAIKKRLKAR